MTSGYQPERLSFDRPIAKPNTRVYAERIEEIADMYKDAFGGYPWFEDLSDEAALARVKDHAMKPGFEAFIAKDDEENIIGGLWYDTPTRDDLVAERGREIGHFAEIVEEHTGITALVWARESIVRPEAQGQGLATQLRRDFLTYLEQENPNGVLVLTRMRDDNHGIIKVAERFGYERTSIRMPSSMNPDVHHEYWYKIINDPQYNNE